MSNYVERTCTDLYVAFDKAKSRENLGIQSNLSHCDWWAMKWLKSSVLIDVPTDKSLGTAVCTRAWYDDQAEQHLNAQFVVANDSTLHSIVSKAQHGIVDWIKFNESTSVFDFKVHEFVRCLCTD